MYVMFQLRPFTVHNVCPCFYGPNKVIISIDRLSTFLHFKGTMDILAVFIISFEVSYSVGPIYFVIFLLLLLTFYIAI